LYEKRLLRRRRWEEENNLGSERDMIAPKLVK
jgi:hypothetical protein